LKGFEGDSLKTEPSFHALGLSRGLRRPCPSWEGEPERWGSFIEREVPGLELLVTFRTGTGIREFEGRRLLAGSGVIRSAEGVNARCIKEVGNSISSRSLSDAARLGDLARPKYDTGAGMWDGVCGLVLGFVPYIPFGVRAPARDWDRDGGLLGVEVVL
jgi:hypothetical protein